MFFKHNRCLFNIDKLKLIRIISYFVLSVLFISCGTTNAEVNSLPQLEPLSRYPGLGPSVNISAVQPSSNHMILLEKLDQDWCEICNQYNHQTINLFFTPTHNLTGKAILITYHPGQIDHIGNSISPETQAFLNSRYSSYAIYGYPYMQKNGHRDAQNNDYHNTDIQTILNTNFPEFYQAQTTNFSINVSISDHTATLSIHNYDTIQNNHINTRIITLLVEEDYTYTTAPGTNGQTRFYRSVIDLIAVDSLTAKLNGQSQTIIHQFNEHPLPVINFGDGQQRHPSNVSLVVFIQNLVTLHVYQSINVPLRAMP